MLCVTMVWPETPFPLEDRYSVLDYKASQGFAFISSNLLLEIAYGSHCMYDLLINILPCSALQ